MLYRYILNTYKMKKLNNNNNTYLNKEKWL